MHAAAPLLLEALAHLLSKLETDQPIDRRDMEPGRKAIAAASVEGER